MHNFGNLQAFKKRYFGRLWDQAMTKAGLESSANKICKPTANQRATRTKRNGESGAKSKTKMARPKRFELLTPRFVVWCSIQLSYGRACR
jgi:hypothetical protein